MEFTWVSIVLLGVAGFLLGGAWSLRRTSRAGVVVLLVGAVLAAAGAVLWTG
ncbi:MULTISPECIES: hypothetical protein [Actinoalloteichus]|uniref:hypothetical protein n=1 Tax=Actinoalloteichus TaxID=65496 RepID=UPI000427C1BF|nr:hypothetical protein [Actinoalloteichus caeruleus]